MMTEKDSSSIAEGVYKKDYSAVTSLLLYENVSYDDVTGSVQKIADWLKK